MHRLLPLLLSFTLACGDKSEDTATTDDTDDTSDIADTEDTSNTEDTSDTDDTDDTDTPNDVSPEELGKTLFEDNCMGCHGADATGMSGPNIQDKSDETFVAVVQNGKGYMPSFPDLTDTDIGNIIAYVRSL